MCGSQILFAINWSLEDRSVLDSGQILMEMTLADSGNKAECQQR